MNYELLGNGDAHVHRHLFPRFSRDLGEFGHHGKGPVWFYPFDKMYSDSNRPTAIELEDMKAKLIKALDQLMMKQENDA